MAIRCKKYNLATRLQQLINLLEKYKFVHNGRIQKYPLETLLNTITRIDTRARYHIPTTTVFFNASASGMNANPGINNDDLSIILEIGYDLDPTKTDISDILPEYSLELEMSGKRKDNSSGCVKFAWHLDKETVTYGKYIHPLFHFHAGGRRLKCLATGNLMMLSSPRVAYPPMDIFLAINFIILNFFNKSEFPEEYAILSDDEYIALINQSESLIMEPYFSNIKNNLGGPNKYFPIYV